MGVDRVHVTPSLDRQKLAVLTAAADWVNPAAT